MANFKDIMALCLDGATYSAIAAALGCSRRDIAKVKTLIADHGITKESFAQLDPSFFDEHFSDHRGARRKRYDQPDFEKLAKRLANNKHLTRHKLWMDYVAAPAGEGESKYQYSQSANDCAPTSAPLECPRLSNTSQARNSTSLGRRQGFHHR